MSFLSDTETLIREFCEKEKSGKIIAKFVRPHNGMQKLQNIAIDRAVSKWLSKQKYVTF